MRKVFLFGFLAVIFSSCATFQSNASYAANGRIAIVEVISDGSTSVPENRHLTRYMHDITEQTFTTEILTLMRENVQPLLMGGKTLEECDLDCLVQVGKSFNAAFITQAYIVRSEEGFSVTSEIYDVASGQKIGSATNIASSESSIERTVFLSTAQMYNQFTGK
ncbi:MAG: hypothetical protein MJZ25_12535 [Fibrobacter sp.]|nr:hypothetical protein [Fibrobacter sp.]